MGKAPRRYARHYARAVFEVAHARGMAEMERWEADFRSIGALGQDATVVGFLQNPRFPFADKARILSEGLSRVNPLALNLVYLLMTRGRLGMLGGIADEYQHLLDGYRGVMRAVVKTAVPLEEADERRLKERLTAVLGKTVLVKPEVDAAVVGGFVARVDHKLIDGSVRNRLQILKRELGGG